MTEVSRLLVLGQIDSSTERLLGQIGSEVEIVRPENIEAGLRELQQDKPAGLLIAGSASQYATGLLLESNAILERIPDAIALVNDRLEIVWSNGRLREMTGHDAPLTKQRFYDVFGTPEILGPDYCPFNTAIATGRPADSTLRVGDKSYFDVHAEPVSSEPGDDSGLLVVVVRDVSADVVQRQKLNAIYQAGLELGDLLPQDVLDMAVEDRVELLKSRILHYTQDLLGFDTIEIRLLDRETNRLDSLLSVGMDPQAESRELFADPVNNGVTGFVAVTGKSYLCDDTANDPLYLTGAPGARSSLTVPLILHDEVMGTFNVESPGSGAFDNHDLQFLELFSREIAVALNTLELLIAEKFTTASQSTEMIMQQVASPVDEIINDAAWVLERYIGHDPDVCDRLQRVLQHTRDIRQLIQRIGEEITPGTTYSQLPRREKRPILQDKRILVADADDSVRSAAHQLLGQFGCEVETAHNGEEVFLMARSFRYDVVIVDIRLPDLTGYDCFCELQKINPQLPVILMTNFGYDPTHSIVNARQQGCRAVLYKPFRLAQLITEVENAVSPPADLAGSPS